MVSPYFQGAESISGLNLPQFQGVEPCLGAETWWLVPNVSQNVAPEGQKSRTAFGVWTRTCASRDV